MRAWTALPAALALLVSANVGRAEPLYHQDFQKGVAPEWAASSVGDARLTIAGGNVSLQLTGHAAARAVVATRGLTGLVVRARLAAHGLADGDACLAEVSPDDGTTWLIVMRVERGRDNGVDFVQGAFADPRLDRRGRVWVRLRADLSRPEAACRSEDVDVSGDPPSAWPEAAAFTPSAAALPPAAPLAGRLSLRPRPAPDSLVVLTGDPVAPGDSRLRWPDLDLELVADGNRVIPAARGPLPSDNPEWNWVISPGVAWREPADGLTRVLLPVALEERNANCLHDGRLLLLLGAGGGVLRAMARFDADTCAYFRFEARAEIPATFAAGAVGEAAAVIARDRGERAARPPAGSLADLTRAWPLVDVAALARAAGPFAVWGLDDGHTHFAAPCPTRDGPDPLCAERALPSYSLAKSLVGAVALMRLEAFRPGVAGETVSDHAPACAGKGWDDVRLIDLLDMVSGHFVSPEPQADEDSPAVLPFFLSTTAAAKTAFACGQPRKAPPGRRFVYHTADSYLLGVAIQDALRRDGLGRDLYADLVAPVWRAIGQSGDLDDIRRTEDAVAQPFTGWGLTLTRDDIVRAARFLSVGALDGRAWLDPALLAGALQTAPPGGGATAGSPHFRYRHGFWARDIAPLIGCAHPVWTPFLSGYGGISVVLFPNGVTFYAVGDREQFDWAEAAAQVARIRPMCR